MRKPAKATADVLAGTAIVATVPRATVVAVVAVPYALRAVLTTGAAPHVIVTVRVPAPTPVSVIVCVPAAAEDAERLIVAPPTPPVPRTTLLAEPNYICSGSRSPDAKTKGCRI